MITKIMGHLLKKKPTSGPETRCIYQTVDVSTRQSLYLPQTACIYQRPTLYLPETLLVSTRDAPCIYQRKTSVIHENRLVSTRDAPCIYQRRSLYLPETLLVSTRYLPVSTVSTGRARAQRKPKKNEVFYWFRMNFNIFNNKFG